MDGGAWWAPVHGAAKSRARLSDFTFTFHFHALEKEMATHSSVLAWRIPGTGEPGGLPSLGSHRVGHDWSNLAAAAAFSLKVNHTSIIQSATSLLGISPREMKTYQREWKYTKEYSIILEYSFMEAPNGKQPKCPSVDEWINKLWHSHTKQYYWAMKRNEPFIYAIRRWIWVIQINYAEFKSQTENKHTVWFHYIKLLKM